MTLQQLEYIVAADKYRHFVKAAEACGVTQSTLSSMIGKLEDELDLQIFDRNSHPVKPTEMGENVIAQAKVLLYNASQLKEMVLTKREQEEGEIKMGIIPTVAPYILPKLLKIVRTEHPGIMLHVSEARTAYLIQKLEQAEIDMALLTTPLGNRNLLEIPVYYEKFVAYISPDEPLFKKEEIQTNHIPQNHLWVLQEGHCLRNQVMNICNHKSGYAAIYEAGSIDTLVKIVDENGGFTIIPEMHVALLSGEQQKRIRKIVDPEPVREVSLVIRKDYVRERLLNVMAGCIREIIPEHMVDSRLKKFAIKL
ncbi:MAG: hydrogen peroxide-inducible genes activator [Bacteroidales bacterium]|nr:hydrogen peroxide-inducible genes activator [Bacteroidales bacterium]MCI1785974.1 hydrogen peroxide-inducible genes activator [Bacteroidales bacterium]